MNAQPRDIWIMGYGNPGRGDDGLGPALAEAIDRLHLPGVTVESDYQLTVEDAAEAAKHEIVLFVDAAAVGAGPFWIKRVRPEHEGLGFSSHGVDPAGVLTIARDIFGAQPTAYIVGIRGYVFDEFRTELSDAARANLDAAAAHLQSTLTGGEIQEVTTEHSSEYRAPTRTAGKERCKTANM